MSTITGSSTKKLPHLNVIINWLEVLENIRHAVDDVLKASDISPDLIMREAAVNPIAVRNSVIRETYRRGRLEGIASMELVDQLSKEYGLAYDTIQAIIWNNR